MKHYYTKLCYVALVFVFSILSSINTNAQLLINEGFNTVLPTGWARQNLSTPAGSNPNWGQGNGTTIAAFSGPATSYAFANFNSVTGANTISNWMFTPEVALANGNVISFYTRATTGGGIYPDRLELRMSTNGPSVNAGTTNTSVGDFTTLLVSVNPTLTTTGYPEVWTKYTVTISGLGAPTTGRFAFRYFVTDGGPNGSNSNYIGVDEVQYGVPCSGAPAPGNTVSTNPSVCSGVPFTLSAQNPPAAMGITYQWQSGTSATGPWTNITGATNPTLTTTITTATYFQAIVSCGSSNTASTPIQVTMNPPSACYCTPPATNCTFDDEILNVKLGTLNNSSSGCSGAGFTNYTTTVAAATNVFIGVANPMTVTIGPGGNDNIGVWIDYNTNGTFDASEFTLLGSAASGPITGNILVPSTLAVGTYRMRVRVKYGTPALTGTQACAAYTFGETEDYLVTVAPCVTSSVTTQPPATKTIACSGTGTIAATIAGSLNQYQWQYLPTGTGAVWTDILPANTQYTGANTNTLTIVNALPTINGYQYRVRYVGACTSPSVTSATTLTVGALAPTVSNTLPINRCTTDAPTAITIATPVGLAALSTTASGTLHTMIPDNNDETIFQNTNLLTHSMNVTGIPAGATITGFSVKLNVTHSWIGDMVFNLRAPDGKIINLDYVLTGTGGTGATTAFTNTIISSTGIQALNTGTNPWSSTFRLDRIGATPPSPIHPPTGPAGFIPTTTTLTDMNQGNGTWTLALYDYYGDLTTANFLENWELNISYLAPPAGVFSPITGLFTDAAGTVAYVAGTPVSTVYANPATSTVYTATVNTAVCGAGTVSIPVNVGSPLSGTSTVANITGCVGGNVTFSSTAPTGGLNATSQWQVSTDAGVTWTNITGATAATYTITGVTTAMTGNRYRVVRTVASCSSTLTSSAGTLTVAPTPVLTVSANPYTAIYPGQTTTLAVASSTTVPANGYQWYKDGLPVAGATSNTLVVDIDGLGSYTVTAADANACGNVVTPSITITAAQNDILFIYPSPNNGQFYIRYFSELGQTSYPRVVNMYDMKGSRVYSKSFNINSPYTRLDINASILGNGIYQVELIDLQGNRIKTGRVLIQK